MCAAPQLLQRPVVLDAARDDDGRGDAQLLVREVDLLGGLGALELVDRQRVAVDTASARQAKCSAGSDTCGHEASLPHSFDRLILGQVERQQLCISSVEASVREVDVLLLWLNTAEGDELRQLSSSSHEGVSAVAEVVIEDAVRRRGVAR